MRRIISLLLVTLFLLPILRSPVSATDNSARFSFDLSVDGKEIKEVKSGDIITVVLKLKRVDSQEPYTMYAMQDEIQYDSTFFEIIKDGTVLNNGIASTDIAKVDRYREFYMNYLSMSGGTQWNSDMLIGSIQLRVIGDSGVSKINSQDYLVSMQDGSGSYSCIANNVTIILSTDCVVRFVSNGGSEIGDQIVQYGENVNRPKDPVRKGYRFVGWYTDITLHNKWDFDRDTVQSNMSLYAKWETSTFKTTVPNTGDISSNNLIWLLPLMLVLFFIILRRIKHRKKY